MAGMSFAVVAATGVDLTGAAAQSGATAAPASESVGSPNGLACDEPLDITVYRRLDEIALLRDQRAIIARNADMRTSHKRAALADIDRLILTEQRALKALEEREGSQPEDYFIIKMLGQKHADEGARNLPSGPKLAGR